MSPDRPSMRAEYVAAKYCLDAWGPPFPHPKRPLPNPSTQQPRDVRKLSFGPRGEALQHTPSAIAPQILQVSPQITPEASLQKSVSVLGALHSSGSGDDVSNFANVQQHVPINSVGHLTSLLLQRQDLQAQLCTLEGIKREQSPLDISPLARRDTSRQPFTDRLAGILPSLLNSPRNSRHSNQPSYYMPLLKNVDNAPFGVKHARRPAPLNSRSPEIGDYCALQFPHMRGTREFIKDCYQDTMLKLAAVELEIVLIYLSADQQSARRA